MTRGMSIVALGVTAVLAFACVKAGDMATAPVQKTDPAGVGAPAETGGRKKIEKQLAECAGCQAASKKAQDRASGEPDKIGAAQCETCKGYWAANGNEKNGGLHFSKKCQQCARMEAAGRDGACDACQKTHAAKKKNKHDKN